MAAGGKFGVLRALLKTIGLPPHAVADILHRINDFLCRGIVSHNETTAGAQQLPFLLRSSPSAAQRFERSEEEASEPACALAKCQAKCLALKRSEPKATEPAERPVGVGVDAAHGKRRARFNIYCNSRLLSCIRFGKTTRNE